MFGNFRCLCTIICLDLKFLPMLTLAQDLPPPMVITGEAINVTSNSAILTGSVSGRAPSIWFEYGTTSGSYDSVASARWDGPELDKVTSSISGLYAVTAYYYRIAAYDTYPEGITDTVY